uniref:L-type lectin-like domain-containing protein n=1 Tax=Arcella intermedia TaxID=1963864 RepID=A0A6B2L4C4_9EUKA
MDSYVRLTPNQQSLKGAVWTTRPLRTKDWEIHVQFAIGSEGRLGADGMAIWYTKQKAQIGPVMGSSDRWQGLGVILDTFDNDGQRDNPLIYAVYNDNNFAFDPSTDGKENTLGSCPVNIRQVNSHPENKFSKLKMRLQDKILTISYDISAITGSEPNWVECFRVPLPIEDEAGGYYLGITAETGGLSDYHDVKSVSTWSLRTPPKPKAVEEKQKVEKNEPKNEPRSEPRSEQRSEKKEEQRRDPPAPPSIPQKRSSDDPVSEIVNRLIDLEKRDDSFSSTLEEKFREMQAKLETMEREQAQVLTKLMNGLDNIRSAVDVTRVEELKKDVKNALSSLNAVQQRINQIEAQIDGTTRKTDDLKGAHDAKVNELKDIVERSSSWGFWTYFMIFQILFFGAFFWWRKGQEEKSKKFL